MSNLTELSNDFKNLLLEDREWKDYFVQKIEEDKDEDGKRFLTIHFTDGGAIGCYSETAKPEPGQKIYLFSKGIGYRVRGIFLENGEKIFYRTAEEDHAEWQKEVKEIQERHDKMDAEERAKPRPQKPGYTLKQGMEEKYAEYTNKNNDAYGAACVRFANAWGTLLERRMREEMSEMGGTEEQALYKHADSTSREADTEGITGFKYRMAVNELSFFWVHGEILRKWHNKEWGHPEAQGVVNPALMKVEVKES